MTAEQMPESPVVWNKRIGKSGLRFFVGMGLTIGFLNLFLYWNPLGLASRREFAGRNAFRGVEKTYQDLSRGNTPKSAMVFLRRDALHHPVLLLSSNSQDFAINSPKPGDDIVHQFMNRDFKHAGMNCRVFLLAMPNITPEEMYVQALEAAALPVRHTIIILGIGLQIMRHSGIRPSIRRLLARPSIRLLAEKSLSWRGDKEAAMQIRADMKRLQNSRPRNDMRQHITVYLRRVVPVFNYGPSVRGLLLGWVWEFKNWVFRIHSYTKRSLVAQYYRQNLEFLDMAFKILRSHGYIVLAYIQPTNPKVNPWLPRDEMEFSRDLRVLCRKWNVVYRNYYRLVPASAWGVTTTAGFGVEPDFVHFKEPGHEKLAEKLAQDVIGIMRGAHAF